MLDIQVHGPEVGDGRSVQETVPGEPLHEGLKLLCSGREMVLADPGEQAVKAELEATSLYLGFQIFKVR